MDIIEILKLVCLVGLFVVPYMVVMAAFAIVGTQLKQRSARRVLKAQARGAFADLETPKNKSRFRLLAGIAFFGVLGFSCSIAVFALQSFRYYMSLETEPLRPYWFTIVVGLIFGVIGAAAGLLMCREFNRRL